MADHAAEGGDNDVNIGDSECPTVATATASTKRSHEEMTETTSTAAENETSKSNINNSASSTTCANITDNALLFASGMERLKRAQLELTLAQQHMNDIRQTIRATGNFEPDSLLFLCDGEDNHILACIMNCLTMEDMGRCELVCHTLKKQAMHYWDKLDTEYFMKHPTLRSPSAQNSREAVIRYKVASQLAERIGNFKESISKHLIVKVLNYDDELSDVRVDDYCQGCALPDMDFNPFRPETRNEYELFVRFCRTSDNKLLAEGFCPIEREDSTTSILLRDMDYSQWPQFAELTRLIETSEGDSFANEHNDNLLDACLRDVTAVVIGVHKETSKATLTIVQCNFGINPSTHGDHGIDNMGDHGFCWPKGSMSAHSHHLETIWKRQMALSTIITSNDNRHCDAKLGLLWTNHVWNDRETDQVSKVECHWTLDCNCEYYQREY